MNHTFCLYSFLFKCFYSLYSKHRKDFKHPVLIFFMKKKRMLLALVMLALILVSLNLVLADNNLTKSYTCLRQKIAEKSAGYSSLTNEEKVFSLLALSSNNTEKLLLQASIYSSIQSNGCLSGDIGTSGSCSLKTTGMGLLALTLTGGDTSRLESWLNSSTNVDSNTEWYLEIDSGIAECRVYSGNNPQATILIDKDRKISGTLTGGCFSYSFGGPFDGYWLKISPDCYSENITTICNETFITSLIYKKSDSVVYYIPDTAKLAAANGQTNEKVNAFCFGNCNDYEGSLWATIALKEKNIDIEKFKPYLYTSASNNQALLPSAFLFKISDLTTKEYYKTELLNKKDPMGKWWQPSRSDGTDGLWRDYYTSLAVWVLGKDTTEASKARDYLIKDELQASTDGCLKEPIRDTAFALFAVSGLQSAPYVPINLTIEKPNQTTVIDTAYPTVEIIINTGAGSVAQDCTYKLDNGNWANLSFSYGTTWKVRANVSTSSYFSQHSLNISCDNIAGQEKTASKDFNLSIVSMNISIKEPKLTNSPIKTQTTSVRAELNTESRDCNFSFDSESKRYRMEETDLYLHSWVGQGTIPLNGIPDKGKHSVTVFCIDTLGKEINKREEFNVDIEVPEPPTNGSLGIIIDNPKDKGEYGSTAASTLLKYVNLTTTSAIAVSSCMYSLDTGSAISMIPLNASDPIKWSAPLNNTLITEGNHSITASCIDANGNSAQKIISFIFNTTYTPVKKCVDEGYYCLNTKGDCVETAKADGVWLSSYYCNAGKFCCDENYVPVTGTTCAEKGGIICEYNEECDGTPILSASDTNGNVCCDETCRPVSVTTSCTSKNGACRSTCNSDETLSSLYFCDSGNCCLKSGSSPKPKNYWWVWVLLILIILVALGIFFREKVKEIYYRITKKGGKGPGQGQQGRPPFGPGPGIPPTGMGMPRRMIPGMQRPMMRPAMPSARPFPKDKELNDTLAKLKNMGK